MVGNNQHGSTRQLNPHYNMNSEARLDVFKSHWLQAVTVMNKANGASSVAATRVLSHGARRATNVVDEAEVVLRYVDQMTVLLVEEPPTKDGSQGVILDYVLSENVLMKLLTWSTHTGKHSDHIWLHQLKMYECLAGQSRQQLLLHKPVIQPLLTLLTKCASRKCEQLQAHSVLLLHQLSITLSKLPQLLELLFNASADHGPAKFLMFSLLIPYVHFEGSVGQQARDALLLIMALSSQHDHIGIYIAEHSDFCPVLATGLSGLYSSLPQKLSISGDDWYQLTEADISTMPDLAMFLNSLEFCNAVVQVSHHLVRDQLLKYIHDGFLLPVIAPALHQDVIKLPSSMMPSYLGNSSEEVIASTAYLELFIRRTTEPSMIATFLKFLLTERHDDTIILDSLISRINSMSRLCMVSLSLFTTLVNLNCEDVMFQLVFRYLIPCTHVMVSQRRAVRDLDLYGRSAQKFLSLTPACCTSVSQQSTPQQTPMKRKTPNKATGNKPTNGLDSMERPSYITYLHAAEQTIRMCSHGCSCWSAKYDGEHPPPDSLILANKNSSSSPSTEPSPESSTESSITDKLGTAEQDSVVSEVDSALSDSFITESSTQPNVTSTHPTTDNKVKDPPTDGTYSHQDSGVATGSSMDTTPVEERPNGHADHQPELCLNNNQSDSVDQVTHSRTVSTCSQASISPCDSPLEDGFANIDFNKFLLKLKDIDTPVEYDSSIEESIDMIDELISNIHHIDTVPQSSSPTEQQGILSVNVNMNVSDAGVARSPVIAIPTSPKDCSDSLSPTLTSPSSPDFHHQISIDEKSSGAKTRVSNPAKYPVDSPNIGPFLSALLQKLETIMQNTLYVNLLLTGLLTRLGCYSQPLLRSFLLNHTLVFQPTVKSLFQVLGSVKHKLDRYSYTVDNFDELLTRARVFLSWREEQYFNTGTQSLEAPKKPESAPPKSKQSVMDIIKDKRRGSLIGELFRRNSSDRRSSHGSDTRLQNLSHGYKYVNKAANDNSNSKSMLDQIESVKTKNVVYAALVLEEFLKELAAITQEHAVHVETQNTV